MCSFFGLASSQDQKVDSLQINILKTKIECKTKNWNPWQILSFGLAKMGIFFSQGVHILVFQVVGLANLQKK